MKAFTDYTASTQQKVTKTDVAYCHTPPPLYNFPLPHSHESLYSSLVSLSLLFAFLFISSTFLFVSLVSLPLGVTFTSLYALHYTQRSCKMAVLGRGQRSSPLHTEAAGHQIRMTVCSPPLSISTTFWYFYSIFYFNPQFIFNSLLFLYIFISLIFLFQFSMFFWLLYIIHFLIFLYILFTFSSLICLFFKLFTFLKLLIISFIFLFIDRVIYLTSYEHTWLKEIFLVPPLWKPSFFALLWFLPSYNLFCLLISQVPYVYSALLINLLLHCL